MKTIETNGITYLSLVPGATGDWYYGMDQESGDLYEAEEQFKNGFPVKGRKLCLVHYPDGTLRRKAVAAPSRSFLKKEFIR